MSTSARFTSATGAIAQGTDNTDRILNNSFQAPVYATPLAVVTTAANTLVQVGALTGALTVTVGVGSSSTAPFVGDKMTFLFTAAADRVVTFSTGTLPTGTLTVLAGKTANISFIFNGAVWCESGRTVTA